MRFWHHSHDKKSTNVRMATIVSLLLAGIACAPVSRTLAVTATRHAGGVSMVDANALVREGAALMERGEWLEAYHRFEQAARLNPGFAIAHFNRGVALVALGRVDEALQAYDEAIQADPSLSQALVNRGVEWFKIGRYADALFALRRAVRTSPALAAAHHNLGVVLSALGRLDEALSSLDRAAALAPEDPAVANARADTYHNMAVKLAQQRRWKDAIAKYRVALDFNPDLPEAFNGIGLALAHLDQHETAVTMYDEAIRRRAGYGEARYNRAVSLAALGRVADAIESCRATLRVRPDLAEARRLLDALSRRLRGLGLSADDEG